MANKLPNIPSDLFDSFTKNQVHLFIGSGVSSASGIISWNDLLTEMKDIIRDENSIYNGDDLESFLSSDDHLDIADLFKETLKDVAYYRFLRKHFRRQVKLSALHKAIAKLPVKTILTSNYDKLIELAFRSNNNIDPSVIIYPNQLGYIDESELRIIKIHGDIDHPNSIILTRSDYANYSSRYEEFELQFKHSINDYTMLFIGFGLSDKNFRKIYDDARQFYDSGKRQAYALMVGTNSVERQLWEKDGLTIIPLKKHTQIPSFIKIINKKLSGS